VADAGDASNIAKSYIHSNSTAGFNTGVAAYTSLFTFGSRLPLTSMYVVTMGRCVGASITCTSVLHFSDATTSASLGSCNVTYNSTWTSQGNIASSNPCLLNLSSATAGDVLGWYTNTLAGTGVTQYDLAFMAFQPVNADLTQEVLANIPLTAPTAVNQIPVSAATTGGYAYNATKVMAGAGAAIPTGPTSSASGDVVTYTGSAGQTQDSGTALTALATLASPTFTGNTTTFANGAAAEQDVAIQPGSSADQIGAVEWNNYSGTSQWKLRKDASNYLRLTDTVNSLDREVFYQNGQTVINAGAGANPAVVNGSTGSGTGGLLVESGGSSPAAVLTVSGSGNTTAAGFVAGKFMIGSGTMTLAANVAAGTSPTIACASSHVCDGVSGTVTLTTGTSTTTGTLATLSFPNTHTNDANCVVTPTLSGTGLVTTISWSESTTSLTLTANAALTASTAYQIRYWCGGN
jgi:hypothetical protein